ncbi:MAG: exo-alpha-sialidase [Pirellulaceae bacterium]|nr:exo-alpha-sialidase [Pirellulaceae bacterium]
MSTRMLTVLTILIFARRLCFALLATVLAIEPKTGVAAEPVIREIEPAVDHNHCTTRQFQHMCFDHDGVWFVFYSDGKDFRYQTSADGGKTWQRAKQPVDQAPNGSTSFDVLKVGDRVYVSHAFYPLGRYDVNAPYAKDPNRRSEYRHEGRIKKGRIEGRTVRWLEDIHPGFTPDYSNLAQDTAGFYWVFTRESGEGIAYRSRKSNDITNWMPKIVCMPIQGRHAMDAAALDGSQLYVVSLLTTEGTLYGNLFDGKRWGVQPILIADDVTTVAGDDRRLAIEFDPNNRRLHLIYVDAANVLRYRCLRSPYRPQDWQPSLSRAGQDLAAGVFTCALSVDSSQSPYGMVITYGLEKHAGRDKRERTGELYARHFDGNTWQGEPMLVSQPHTIQNWYPNVNRDARHGLCVMYSRSVDKIRLGKPLAIMVSVWGQ